LRSDVEFDSEKIGSANHTKLKFQELAHPPCQGWVCGVIKPPRFAKAPTERTYRLHWQRTWNCFFALQVSKTLRQL